MHVYQAHATSVSCDSRTRPPLHMRNHVVHVVRKTSNLNADVGRCLDSVLPNKRTDETAKRATICGRVVNASHERINSQLTFQKKLPRPLPRTRKRNLHDQFQDTSHRGRSKCVRDGEYLVGGRYMAVSVNFQDVRSHPVTLHACINGEEELVDTAVQEPRIFKSIIGLRPILAFTSTYLNHEIVSIPSATRAHGRARKGWHRNNGGSTEENKRKTWDGTQRTENGTNEEKSKHESERKERRNQWPAIKGIPIGNLSWWSASFYMIARIHHQTDMNC